MKNYNFKLWSVLSLLALFLSACNTDVTKIDFKYSGEPTIGEELTITLTSDELNNEEQKKTDIGDVEWELQSKPENSQSVLTVAEDKKSAKITPDIAGNYKFRIFSNDTETSREDSFSVLNTFNLSEGTFFLDEGAIIGKPFLISFSMNDPAAKWEVYDSLGESIDFTKQANGNTITFTPKTVGKIKVSVVNNFSKKTIPISVRKHIPYDFNNIKDVGGKAFDGANQDYLSGIVRNQKIVYLKKEVNPDKVFNKMDYVKLLGKENETLNSYIIEFDPNDINSTKEVESLKFDSNVLDIDYRYHYGKKTFDLFMTPPNDYGNDSSIWSDNIGENYHLEKIDILNAWNIEEGSNKISIGVIDGDFDKNHEDFYIKKGKDIFESVNQNTNDEPNDIAHGNGVVGTIRAVSNNNIGISGINKNSKIHACRLSNDKNCFEYFLDIENLKVINSSWGMAPCKKIDNTIVPKFIIGNKSSEDNFRKELVKYYSKFTKHIDSSQSKLFVWASGNGFPSNCNVELNNKRVYGFDSIYNTYALHGEISKRDNLLLVSASLADNRLAYYSNYGKHIDIAAPTEFKAPALTDEYKYWVGSEKEYGNNKSIGFSGTSASAPVVSGVASLIYSINPNFSGSDVKNILISSATEKVTERYIDPNGNTEKLVKNGVGKEIPILNASAAVKLAKQINDGEIANYRYQVNPKNSTIEVEFFSNNSNFEIASYDIKLEGYKLNRERVEISSTNNSGNNISLPFFNGYEEFKIVGSVMIRSKLTGKTVSTVLLPRKIQSPRLITIHTKDADTNEILSNTEISLTSTSFINQKKIVQTNIKFISDDSGKITLLLPMGKFKISASKPTHNTVKQIVDLRQNISFSMNLPKNNGYGGIHGFVRDTLGNSLSNVRVDLTGMPNDYTTFTDLNGFYSISASSSPDNEYFSLNFYNQDYGYIDKKITSDLVIIDGISLNRNIILNKNPLKFLKVNSTGYNMCGNYSYNEENSLTTGWSHNNFLGCNISSDNNGSPIPYGQDGYYQVGTKLNYKIVKNNTDECVLDNSTGLLWEQKTDDGSIRDKDNVYSYKLNFNAYKYIQELNKSNYCGFSDWRLPNIEELISLVDYSKFSPSIDPIFTNTPASSFWSSSRHPKFTSGYRHGWLLDFNQGNTFERMRLRRHHIRAVRSTDNLNIN